MKNTRRSFLKGLSALAAGTLAGSVQAAQPTQPTPKRELSKPVLEGFQCLESTGVSGDSVLEGNEECITNIPADALTTPKLANLSSEPHRGLPL